MKLADIDITMKSRSDTANLYPIGDLHIGTCNCVEKKIKEHVQRIADDSTALWFGGGDIIQNTKRFDPDNLPDWMLTGVPNRIRSRTKDLVKAQLDYAFELFAPIKNKCIGMLEGDQEHAISNCYNRDIMSEICKEFEVPNLTDCAWLRFNFLRGHDGVSGGSSIRAYIYHGNGGRSPGAEPAHLTRIAQERDCELILCGHSHNFHIMPAITRLTIPKRGVMPEQTHTRDVRVANWGSWLSSHVVGPSRSNDPVRGLSTLCAHIRPFKEINGLVSPEITINEIVLS